MKMCQIVCALILSLMLAGTAGAAGFRASAVRVDITPTESQWLLGYRERQSDGVNDRIYHRVAALDDGTTRLFIISSDVAEFSPAYFDKVAQQIQRELGIPPESIWWTATHTHSAPELGPPGMSGIFLPDRYKQASSGESNPAYSRFAEAKLIEALQEARGKLAPARLGLGLGFSTANINRRAHTADGKIRLGMNPDGPTDRQIGLIRLESEDGKLIALIANYAIHGTVLGSRSFKISGDAPGVVAEYVEQRLGAPALFINGAMGDIAPIYSTQADARSGHLDEFRLLLGNRILEANKRIGETVSNVSLRTAERWIETPLRRDLVWPAEMQKYARATPGGATQIRIPVRFLQINQEAVLWGAPLELFCEIAMDVRQHSRFPFTFHVGLLNGTLDYLPTAQAIREQGYEPSVSPFTERAEDDFRQGVIEFLASLVR
jgi:neutral ceramidase